MSNNNVDSVLTQRVLLAAFFFSLLIISYRVLYPFFAPIAWAIILTYVTWPIYRLLRDWLGQQAAVSALLMTLFLCAFFVIPIIWLITLLHTELPSVYQAVANYLAQGPQVIPESIARIPWFGSELQALFVQMAEDHDVVTAKLVKWAEPWIDEFVSVLGGVGLNTFKFGFAILTSFFLYRDGEALLDQIRTVLSRFLGERTKAYLPAIGDTVRAVLYGLILTALAQGLLAGLGYWAAGVPAPVLLGTITAMLALIPFGAPLVWGTTGIWLLLADQIFAGISLLLWGALVVSQIDNLIRPLVVSSATRIPFLLVLIGVLGGIRTFGLVGMFLGPVVIAVLLAAWREWVEEQVPSEPFA